MAYFGEQVLTLPSDEQGVFFHFLFSRYFRQHHRTFDDARCFSVAIVQQNL